MFESRICRCLLLVLGCWSLSVPVSAVETSITIDGITLKDPTRPAGWQAGRVTGVSVQRPTIRLESIIYSPQRRIAVINGRTLAEGQQSNGVKVVKIEQRRVLLEWQGDRWHASVSAAADGSFSIRRTQ
ncbi:general secretion pathway protein GspB [Hahella ganghwensis]|uniref:general secretion pathway protein GspB n=1 Tax=Hahella ganghwensis TaxID=286420 RepID=UPI000360897A|nr:general secretion pathway protein GspB [Hahella ganghwensis]